MASSGMTLPGTGFGLVFDEPPEPSMRYAPPPPSSTTTAATMMMSSFFLDFLGAASPLAGVEFDMGQPFGIRTSVGRGRQEGPFVGRQAGQHDDVHPAVHGHRARVARRDQRTGTGEAGGRHPVARQLVLDEVADDRTGPGGGQL